MDLTLGQTVQRKLTGTDSLTFQLRAGSGAAFAVYIDALDSGMVATVLDPQGRIVGEAYHLGARSVGADSLWAVLRAASDGEYAIRVRTADPSRMGGTFTLRAEWLDNPPETASPFFHVNDTVSTEILQAFTDRDDFQFDGVAGQAVDLFVQSLSSSKTSLNASLFRLDSPTILLHNWLGSATAVGNDKELEASSFRAVALPATGRYLVRIEATRTTTGVESTPPESYRFQVRVIAPAP